MMVDVLPPLGGDLVGVEVVVLFTRVTLVGALPPSCLVLVVSTVAWDLCTVLVAGVDLVSSELCTVLGVGVDLVSSELCTVLVAGVDLVSSELWWGLI